VPDARTSSPLAELQNPDGFRKDARDYLGLHQKTFSCIFSTTAIDASKQQPALKAERLIVCLMFST